jgi:hypothetical protein
LFSRDKNQSESVNSYYLASDRFTKYIEEHEIIDDWFYDDAGREHDRTFQICQDKLVKACAPK